MSANRTSFAKLQRDRAKKAKAAAKRARREGRSFEGEHATTALVDDDREPEVTDDLPEWFEGEAEPSPEQLLEMVETLHRQYEAKAISFEEFEDRKLELMTRLADS
jgi:hypothetical protein